MIGSRTKVTEATDKCETKSVGICQSSRERGFALAMVGSQSQIQDLCWGKGWELQVLGSVGWQVEELPEQCGSGDCQSNDGDSETRWRMPSWGGSVYLKRNKSGTEDGEIDEAMG